MNIMNRPPLLTTEEEREVDALIARLQYLRKLRQARIEAAQLTGLPLQGEQLDELLRTGTGPGESR